MQTIKLRISKRLVILTHIFRINCFQETPKLPVSEPPHPSLSPRPSIVPVSPETENPTEPDSGVGSVVVAPETPAQTETPTSPPPTSGKTTLKANESLSSLPICKFSLHYTFKL